MNKKHGYAGTKIHSCWLGMHRRCKKNPNYGARGIKVCDRWQDFMNFLADMGLPKDGDSIERIDVNGHYEPGNCKWLPMSQQAQNLRRTVYVEIEGQKVCLAQACRNLGLNYRTILSRINILGVSPQEALAQKWPSRKRAPFTRHCISGPSE